MPIDKDEHISNKMSTQNYDHYKELCRARQTTTQIVKIIIIFFNK